MSFDEAHAYLDALGIDAMKAGRPAMHRIEAICEVLNHPELTVPALHVTGTNGKTSTARIATSILVAAGLNVGTYTSPHLQTVRERMTLNGQAISEETFGDVFSHIKPYIDMVEGQLDERLTYFESLTAMFLLWASEAAVDAVVVEVGLGGMWDATNVIRAPVAVVTNVSLDHTELLGNDRVAIAKEKAGIIKSGAVAVTGERSPDVLEVMRDRADGVGASLSVLDKDFRVVSNNVAVGGRYLTVDTDGRTYRDLFVPMHGAHQGVNAAVALQAARRFLPAKELDQDVVAEGLAQTVVRGRLEKIVHPDLDVPVVLDVAHNPSGMSALVGSLTEAFAFEEVIFVVGILADKDYEGMLLELSRLPCSLIATQPGSGRAVPADHLHKRADELGLDCRVVDTVFEAVDRARAAASTTSLICVTGSHYVVGEARTHLLGHQGI